MIAFDVTIELFQDKGEKSGWRYITLSTEQVQAILPNAKKIFQVKGMLDKHAIHGASLLPMGDGTFILPINATMRKAIKKSTGANIKVTLEIDDKPYTLHPDLINLLEEEAEAYNFFKSLAPSHQRYFSKWIDAAKTLTTKVNRLAACINALNQQWDYGTMIRAQKKQRNNN